MQTELHSCCFQSCLDSCKTVLRARVGGIVNWRFSIVEHENHFQWLRSEAFASGLQSVRTVLKRDSEKLISNRQLLQESRKPTEIEWQLKSKCKRQFIAALPHWKHSCMSKETRTQTAALEKEHLESDPGSDATRSWRAPTQKELVNPSF